MKYIFLILICFLSLTGYSQVIQNRANGSVTVQDARWKGLLNMFVPLYADTTAANVQKGIDSTGAIIYTYNNGSLWYRVCCPKHWVLVGTGGSGSGELFAVGDSTATGTRYFNAKSHYFTIDSLNRYILLSYNTDSSTFSKYYLDSISFYNQVSSNDFITQTQVYATQQKAGLNSQNVDTGHNITVEPNQIKIFSDVGNPQPTIIIEGINDGTDTTSGIGARLLVTVGDTVKTMTFPSINPTDATNLSYRLDTMTKIIHVDTTQYLRLRITPTDTTLYSIPVNGTFANGFLYDGGVTILDSTVTELPDIVFVRNDTTYTITTSASYVINSTSPGFYRTDIFYIDYSNTVQHLVGTESASITSAPSVPAGGIISVVIDIHDSTITVTPTPTNNNWTTSGNAITGVGYFGTTNNTSIHVITGNVRRIVIDSTGKTLFENGNQGGVLSDARVSIVAPTDSLPALQLIQPNPAGVNNGAAFRMPGGSLQIAGVSAGVYSPAISINNNGDVYVGVANDNKIFEVDGRNMRLQLDHYILFRDLPEWYMGYATSTEEIKTSVRQDATDRYITVGGTTTGGTYTPVLTVHPKGGNVSIGSSRVTDTSALLDLNHTTNKGLLIMNMTGVQMNAIPLPHIGLMVYNTDSLAYCYYNGSIWQKIGTGSSGGSVDTSGFVHKLYSLSESINGVKTFQDSTIFNNNIHVGGVASVDNNLYVGGQSIFYSGLDAGYVVVGVGTGVSNALFSVSSTTGASIPAPRMTAAQMNAIVSPLSGFMVYNTDSLAYCYYNGSAWRMIGASGGGSTPTLQQVTTAGNTVTSGADVTTVYANDIILDDASNESEFTAAAWYMSKVAGNSAVISLQTSGATPANLKIPLSSSTARVIPVSVNGNYADAAGNITLSGGSDTTLYTGNSYLRDDRGIELNGHYIVFSDAVSPLSPYFFITPTYFNSGFDALPLQYKINTDDTSHTFTGKIKLITIPDGTGTDSLLVIKDTEVKKIAASTFGLGYTVATAVSSSNYTVTTSNYIILPDLTGQANRNIVLPSATSGQVLIVKNSNNTAVSTFNWTFTSGTVKDYSDNTITTLSSQSVYFLIFDGTNWNIN